MKWIEWAAQKEKRCEPNSFLYHFLSSRLLLLLSFVRDSVSFVSYEFTFIKGELCKSKISNPERFLEKPREWLKKGEGRQPHHFLFHTIISFITLLSSRLANELQSLLDFCCPHREAVKTLWNYIITFAFGSNASSSASVFRSSPLLVTPLIRFERASDKPTNTNG